MIYTLLSARPAITNISILLISLLLPRGPEQ